MVLLVSHSVELRVALATLGREGPAKIQGAQAAHEGQAVRRSTGHLQHVPPRQMLHPLGLPHREGRGEQAQLGAAAPGPHLVLGGKSQGVLLPARQLQDADAVRGASVWVQHAHRGGVGDYADPWHPTLARGVLPPHVHPSVLRHRPAVAPARRHGDDALAAGRALKNGLQRLRHLGLFPRQCPKALHLPPCDGSQGQNLDRIQIETDLKYV